MAMNMVIHVLQYAINNFMFTIKFAKVNNQQYLQPFTINFTDAMGNLVNYISHSNMLNKAYKSTRVVFKPKLIDSSRLQG